MKKLSLTASDFNTITNLIECNKINLVEGQTWVPICLPHFDDCSFLYAHISYMWGGEGPCLILLGTAKDDFSRLSKVRDHFEESISNYKRLESLRKELIHPKSMRSISSVQLWHFVYKNVLSAEVYFSIPQIPFVSANELQDLYKGYVVLADFLRHNKTMKIVFHTTEKYTLFAWVTTSFELHCTFSPLASTDTLMETTERLLKFLRKEEKQFFIGSKIGLLGT